jgi:dTDP-4-dehydrorhamnose reductase
MSSLAHRLWVRDTHEHEMHASYAGLHGRRPLARATNNYMSTKCLIVGGSVVIGSALKAALSDSGREVWITVRPGKPTGFHGTIQLDLSAAGDFRLPINPHSAFLCAAQSKFLDCESDAESSRRVNVSGNVAVAGLLQEKGAFVVFLSSGAVFDGSARLAGESSQLSATTEYGRQKAETEKRLLELDNGKGSVAIVRMTKVLSSTTDIVRKFMEHLKRGESVEAFSDFYLSPVSLSYVVNCLLIIESLRAGGIFHLSGDTELSYAEFARRLAKKLGVSADLVHETTVESSQIPPLYRPRHPALGMSLTAKTLSLNPEPIDAMLANLLADASTEP